MPTQRICKVFRRPGRTVSRDEILVGPTWHTLRTITAGELRTGGGTGRDYLCVVLGRLGEVEIGTVIGPAASKYLFVELRVNWNGAEVSRESLVVPSTNNDRDCTRGTDRAIPFQFLVPAPAWPSGAQLVIQARVTRPAGTSTFRNPRAWVEGLTVAAFDRTEIGATKEAFVDASVGSPTNVGAVGTPLQLGQTGILDNGGGSEKWLVFWECRMLPGVTYNAAFAYVERLAKSGSIDLWESPGIGIGGRHPVSLPNSEDRHALGNAGILEVDDDGSRFRLKAVENYSRTPFSGAVLDQRAGSVGRTDLQLPANDLQPGITYRINVPGSGLVMDRDAEMLPDGWLSVDGVFVNDVTGNTLDVNSPTPQPAQYDRALIYAIRVDALTIDFDQSFSVSGRSHYGAPEDSGEARPASLQLDTIQALQAPIETITVAAFVPVNQDQGGLSVGFSSQVDVTASFSIDNFRPLFAFARLPVDRVSESFIGESMRFRGVNGLDVKGFFNPLDDEETIAGSITGYSIATREFTLAAAPGLDVGQALRVIITTAVADWRPSINNADGWPAVMTAADKFQIPRLLVTTIGTLPVACTIKAQSALDPPGATRAFSMSPWLLCSFRAHLDDSTTITPPPAVGAVIPVVPGREASLDASSLRKLLIPPSSSVRATTESARGELRTLDGYLITWPTFTEPGIQIDCRWVFDEKQGEDPIGFIDYLRDQNERAFAWQMPGDPVERPWVAIGSSIIGPTSLGAKVWEVQARIVELQWVGSA